MISEIAEIVTALATCIVAWSAWKQLPLIAEQMAGLRAQLDEQRKARIAADERERIWGSVRICERYDSDINLENACARIWKDSEQGKDYNKADKRDLIIVLNFLESVAVGVEQNLYVEAIIKDNLETVVEKTVHEYLLSGLVKCDRDEYRSLLALYRKWFPSADGPSFRHMTVG